LPDTDTTSESPTEAGAAANGKSTDFGATARTYLARARKAATEADAQPLERADVLIKSANVMALLDLADAIRTTSATK
jgi:hypothetical protein